MYGERCLVNHNDVIQKLTPCGLDCERCANYRGGEIQQLSQKLLASLGNFARVAKMSIAVKPEFEHYDHFISILTHFAGGPCNGCRSEEVNCPVKCPFEPCRSKGIDFCFQCPDYPCDSLSGSKFGEASRQRNDRVKELGVKTYYEERLKVHRYP